MPSSSHWKQSFEEVLRSPLPSWKGRRETQGAGLRHAARRRGSTEEAWRPGWGTGRLGGRAAPQLNLETGQRPLPGSWAGGRLLCA